MKTLNEYGQPNSIKEIRKYINDMGYDLQIWKQFDLFGATIGFGNHTVFGREFYVDLNVFGKYVAKNTSKKDLAKAELHAAQKAYWFVNKFLKKTEKIPMSKQMRKMRADFEKQDSKKLTLKEEKKMLKTAEMFLDVMNKRRLLA